MNTPRKPVLLVDEPSPTDLLGGAHERVAATIVTLLQNSPGGQTIRLDGMWGSGKSTVVRMVSDELERISGGGNFAVFTYDAWVHTGDPLRRAFLSALLEKLRLRHWLRERPAEEENYWQRKLAQLSRRFKVTSKRTKPLFSPTAKRVLTGLVALAVASPALAEFTKKLLGDFNLFELALATVAIGSATFWVLNRFTAETFGFIVRRSTDEEQVETHEDPEPTSVEFQQAFGELMSEVLADSSRRLLIVVDNLDRIDRNETQSIWSLLRSFLDNPQFVNRPWFRRIWVLVPVADEKRVLLTSLIDAASAGGGKDPSPSFLEKVFQIRLALPPPMLHSWKNYLNAKLVEAFGDDLTGDYDEILRLYDELRPQESLTPRALVSFVNELVVMKLEWKEEATLASLAAYLLSKEVISESKYAPSPRVAAILREPNLSDTFAMLHHRAGSRAEASYLSVRPRLDKALDDADADALAALFEESPGFGHVLDRYVRQELPGLESQQERLLQAVRALAPLARHDGSDRPPRIQARAAEQLRHTCITTFLAGPALRLANPNILPGLEALFSLISNERKVAGAVVLMLRRLALKAESNVTVDLKAQFATGWDTWADALIAVLSLPPVKEITEEPLFERISLPLEPGTWARLCHRALEQNSVWMLHACEPMSGPMAQVQWLENELRSRAPTPEELSLIKFHMETGDPEFFDAAARGLVAGYRAPDSDGGRGKSAIRLCTGMVGLLKLDRSRLSICLKDSSREVLSAYASMEAEKDVDFWRASLFFLIAYLSKTQPSLSFPHGNDAELDDSAIKGQSLFKMLIDGKIGLNSNQFKTYVDALVELDLFSVLPMLTENNLRSGFVANLLSELPESEHFIQLFATDGTPAAAASNFAKKFVSEEGREQFTRRLMARIGPTKQESNQPE
ncbi:P-loop NTPase fold protein [Caballeronia sp. AZ7_KS35]|uniref:KAP family P-loop NTPase fold protein n=1 Tax=Caballeronia sp. AZ7_KS35 TaxID=2921762 RepID=UPI0020283D0A|nr:P-loop NTPase fold protein [Caballeronia sp. AZ7_KS35]